MNDLKENARKNRHNMPEPEKKIWFEILSQKKLGFRFLRQRVIGRYIVDFYCRELKLVIEIDGDSHADQIDYDKERTRFLESRELVVIRYWNNEAMMNIEGVYDDLLLKVKERKKELSLKTPKAPFGKRGPG